MAFVNEKLTSEQRENLKKMGIKNPYGSAEQITEGIAPLYWTINRENGTWLCWCYNQREVEDDYKEFMFVYKQTPIPIQVVCTRLKEKTSDWKVTRLDLPEGLLHEKQNIKDLIVKAFEIYKAVGWPDVSNMETMSTCSFREGI
jgi:hypothetical protein